MIPRAISTHMVAAHNHQSHMATYTLAMCTTTTTRASLLLRLVPQALDALGYPWACQVELHEAHEGHGGGTQHSHPGWTCSTRAPDWAVSTQQSRGWMDGWMDRKMDVNWTMERVPLPYALEGAHRCAFFIFLYGKAGCQASAITGKR